MVKLINLTKKYKDIVLDNLNYHFKKETIYLIVGENGSGKTTLIKAILDLIKPTSGKVNKMTNEFSYVPDKLNFPEFLKIKDFLLNLGYIYNLKDMNIINHYLTKWKLDGDLKLKELSKGMMQKVLIIQGFLKNANFFIFDEPLSGLDKEMISIFITEVEKLKKAGNTVLIISHQDKEFNKLYDVKLNINKGNLNESFN